MGKIVRFCFFKINLSRNNLFQANLNLNQICLQITYESFKLLE